MPKLSVVLDFLLWNKFKRINMDFLKETYRGFILLIGILASLFPWLISYAGVPVWTFSSPRPKQLMLYKNEKGFISYTITNQSLRSKRLRLKSLHGVTANECYLETKGSTCVLDLLIDGNQIPLSGIHSSPILCEVGNANQCYQASHSNALDISLNLSPLENLNMAAVGYYEIDSSVLSLGYYSQDGGKNWGISIFSSTMFDESLEGISCNMKGVCVAVGNFDTLSPKPLSYYSVDYGKTWLISPSLPTPQGNSSGLSNVSCNINGQCVAVGRYFTNFLEAMPLSYYTEDYGKNWQISSIPPTLPGNSYFLRDISCNMQQSCVAVGQYGNPYLPPSLNILIYYSEDNGKNWSPAISLPAKQGINNSLSGVSCSNKGICTAVGSYNMGLLYAVPLGYYSIDNGRNWSLSSSFPLIPNGYSHEISSVACTEEGVCSAVGFFINVTNQALPLSYYSSDYGKNWSLSEQIPPSKNNEAHILNSVFCLENNSCSSAGYYDNSSASLPLMYYSEDGGVSWVISMLATQGTRSVINAVS